MWGKPYISHVEGEFKTDKLRDKHVFHDASLRVKDPEEFRMTNIEYLRGLGYIVDVNELTEFEDSGELNKLFSTGRLKPLKNIIKARKKTNTGSRFPLAWRLLLLAAVLSTIGYFLPYDQLNKDFLLYSMIISYAFTLVFYLIKRIIVSSIWIKVIGIYDAEGSKADVRAIISADTNEPDSKVFDSLRDDVSEFYGLISRKYVKQEEASEALLKPVPKSKTEEVMTKLITVNKNIQELNNKFINGKVNQETFNKLSNSLENEKDKLETVLDLVSL